MHKILAITAALLLAFAISESDAHCCGRGKHYFCNDCSVVHASGKKKCCHAGTYSTCNVFCCNCHSCAQGNALITAVASYGYKKTYRCTKRTTYYKPPVYKPPVYKPPVYTPPVYKPPVYKPPVYKPPVYKPPVYKPVRKPVYKPVHKYDQDAYEATEDAFSEIDRDGDRSISPDEFLLGLRAHLNEDNGEIVASDLLKTDDEEEALGFADAIASDDVNEDDLDDFEQMARREFRSMDANGDGLIQAQEFDKDLEE